MQPTDRKPAALINRRLLLKAATVYGLTCSLPVSGEDVPATQKPQLQLKKRSKESVKYQDTPYLGRTCAKCMLYVGEGRCAILEETVSPAGWCNQWIPPTLGRAPATPPDSA